MMCRIQSRFSILIYLQLASAMAGNAMAAERLVLNNAAVVVYAAEPSYVQYGVEELASYLKDIAGNSIPVVASPTSKHEIRIVVGQAAGQKLLPQNISAEQLGDDGYVLRTANQDGVEYLVVAGATPRGTKAGIAALMKAIQADGKSAYVAKPLDVVHKPPVAKRGMHFNGWAFNSPYSFRNWREEDWKSYLDILAYQGVNLFYLWPFMEIMPAPLSAEDTAYLEECRRIVEYAQQKHGMEVWIMQCTNRVAKDDCGVKNPRLRPYWRPSQEDLNPGNPEHFARIMASREALYKILNNVDGVCNIDSDPGEYPGSPLSDYLKVLNGCRDLLDRHNLHGKEAKLINWMWTGWGVAPPKKIFDNDVQIETLRILKSDLREPWGLVAGTPRFLPFCRQEGMLDKTVYLHYGVIEGEPAYPGTNLNFRRIRDMFASQVDKNPELAGVMGNLQTPLLQFPHMFFFTSSMQDAGYRKRSDREVLLDVAGYLYPEQQELIANSYAALKEPNPANIQSAADRLSQVMRDNQLGCPGLFGRKLFPNSEFVATSLVLQLNAAAARERLVQQLATSTSPADCERLVTEYLDTYLAWDTAHGWHNLWGWNDWQLGLIPPDPRFPGVFKKIAHCLGDQAAIDAAFERISKTLTAKYDKNTVETGCIAPMKKPVLAALTAANNINVHQLFSDNGILQRDTKVKVWGTTEGLHAVTVMFKDQTATAEPVEGNSAVELGPFEASSEGSDLIISQGKQLVFPQSMYQCE